MNTVIIFFLGLTIVLSYAALASARHATSDGDYGFVIPAGGAVLTLVILAILLIIKFY